MSVINVRSKRNGITIEVPGKTFFAADPDGDFVAELGSITNTVSIKDARTGQFLAKDLNFSNFTVSTSDGRSAGSKAAGAQAGSTAADTVTNLNAVLNRQTQINEIDEVIASGASAGEVLMYVNTHSDGLKISNQALPVDSVVDDTTPQLGGDLDVNGQKITSSGNGDVVIDPDGTGSIILKSDDIQFQAAAATFTSGTIRLYESSLLTPQHFIAIASPASVTSDTTLTLPDGAGSAGQALKTNGSGTLSWGDFVASLNPTISGALKLVDPSPTLRGKILFEEQGGGNSVSLVGPASLSSDVEFTLPDSDGANGQVLKTDGNGGLSFGPITFKDGWHGSTTRIKLLPRDFIPDDGGRPMMIDDSSQNNFFLESFSSNTAYASIEIPAGFKATHVKVNGTSTTDAVKTFEMQIDSKTGVAKGSGTVGTELDITDVTSSSTNYLLLQVANTSGEEIYGGYVTIAQV